MAAVRCGTRMTRPFGEWLLGCCEMQYSHYEEICRAHISAVRTLCTILLNMIEV